MRKSWEGCFAPALRQEFEGKGVIIAGVGDRNIGAALANGFHWLGAKVAIMGHLAEPLQLVANALDVRGSAEASQTYRPVPIAADLTVESARRDAINKACAAVGAPYAFVSTLGHDERVNLSTISQSEFESLTRINLTAPLFMARDIATKMRSGGGVINLFTSHHGGALNDTEMLGYAPAKAGLNKGLQLLARWIAKDNTPGNVIRLNASCPGWVQTPRQTKRFVGAFPKATRGQLVPHEIFPEDLVVPVITNMSRTVSGLTSGTIYYYDGGCIGGPVRDKVFP